RDWSSDVCSSDLTTPWTPSWRGCGAAASNRSPRYRAGGDDGVGLHAARGAGRAGGVRVGDVGVAHRVVPAARLLDRDGHRPRLPDPRRRVADQTVRADRHLRRAAHHRRPVPVGHPGRGLPVRLRIGHRGAAAVGAVPDTGPTEPRPTEPRRTEPRPTEPGGSTLTDPRRVHHPAPPGLPDARGLARRPHVVVAGAGIAGLASAAARPERGAPVAVGGQAGYRRGGVGGWTEDLGPDVPAGAAMNRGFHAFFRQYYNLRTLLRRIDPGLGMLTPVDDYPLVDAHGRRDTFRGLPQTPPLHAMAFALRSPTFRLRDLIRLNARAAAPLAAVELPGIYRHLDDTDAESFLRAINFPPAARHLAFEVFSRSFFAQPSQLSAAELATMFHIYFLGS